jgi:hypothetical protein
MHSSTGQVPVAGGMTGRDWAIGGTMVVLAMCLLIAALSGSVPV